MTASNPLVSIILATYNGEAYIRVQLDSLIQQSYAPLEIIAVDDGSKDNTLNILFEYAAKYNHIKVHANETNLGYIRNFENGCKISTGDFISFCDQDDYWHTDKIRLSMENIDGFSLVHCDSMVCNQDLQESGGLISDRVNYKPIHNCLKQAVFCRIYGHAALFTRDLVEKSYPFPDVIPHDWWLSYMATINNGINYIDQPLVKYRQHASNLYGVIGNRQRKKASAAERREKKKKEIAGIRKRVQLFYDKCPPRLNEEKKILRKLVDSYSSFSLGNNFSRMFLFFSYHRLFLFVKKRSRIANYLFCLKMFTAIK